MEAQSKAGGKAYLDNVIVSGMVRRDLDPPSEMLAVDRLVQLASDGKLALVTSREAWREQEQASDTQVREELEGSRSKIDTVADDHRVRHIEHQQDWLGGFIANIGVSDVVDEPLFGQLKKAGLVARKPNRRDSDALHLMYAVQNDCDWFVTLDRDFSIELEPLCRGLRIVKPSELVAKLAGPVEFSK